MGVGVAFFFRKEIAAVGDDEPDVPGAGRIQARVINLVEDAMAERKSYLARRAQGGPDSGLGARGPARFDARPAGRNDGGSIHFWSPFFFANIGRLGACVCNRARTGRSIANANRVAIFEIVAWALLPDHPPGARNSAISVRGINC